MKISILGTNGFLSTAIAKYANEVGWTLNMYGLDAPIDCEYSNFYKVILWMQNWIVLDSWTPTLSFMR